MTTVRLRACRRCKGALVPDPWEASDWACLSCGHREYPQAPDAYRPEVAGAGHLGPRVREEA